MLTSLCQLDSTISLAQPHAYRILLKYWRQFREVSSES
jgi:hypothetical protein